MAGGADSGDVGRLPAHPTPEEMASRFGAPAEVRKQSSQKQYDGTGKKYFKKFVAYAHWDPSTEAIFVNGEGQPDDDRLIWFFTWLSKENVSEKVKMTKATFKTVLAWAQSALNDQLLAIGKSARPQYISNLPGVKQRKDAIYKGASEAVNEQMLDMQAEMESDIGVDTMLRMCGRCLAMEVPDTRGLLSMTTFFELRASHQQCARHDDLRDEKFCHMFTKEVRWRRGCMHSCCLCIRAVPVCRERSRVPLPCPPPPPPACTAQLKAGSADKRMVMLGNVSNGGKTNSNGRVVYSGVLPHKNPMLCTIFAKGCLFYWRFKV